VGLIAEALGLCCQVLTDDQVVTLLQANNRVLSSALLFGLLTGMRSGEICGLLASDVISKGNLGRFIQIQPNEYRQLKSKAAEREVPLHSMLSISWILPYQTKADCFQRSVWTRW